MPAARAALAAVTFLTRVPVARRLALVPADVTRGSALFPLVGTGIGAAAGLVAALAVHVLPPLAAGGLAVAAPAAAGACSRAVAPPLAAALPNARRNTPGHAITDGWSWPAAAAATALGLAIPVLLLGLDGLAVGGVTAVVALLLGLFYY